MLIASVVIGTAINWLGINPIKALFWSAAINGIVAVPVMIMMMIMIRNKDMMKQFVITSRPLLGFGWLATVLMAFAAVGLLVTSI